jgi:hypothetical protein
VALNYLLISESNEGGGAAKNHCSMGYKPLEQVSYVRKMIKIFIYDLKYYSQRKMLFKSGIDDIS